MSDPVTAGAVLTIDLDAVVANWRLLSAMTRSECAGVVKADAYGTGAALVAPALARAGCRRFFVATLEEGIALRPLLGEAEIFVLTGPYAGTEPEFIAHNLIPVLNEPGQIERWAALAAARGGLPAALHVDTGMSRLGLMPSEVTALAARPESLAAFRPCLLMSHLACSEDEPNEKNEAQRRAFEHARAQLPPMPCSFANSSGIFLGQAYHYDLARPGAALYGVNPQPERPNPMRGVVKLEGRIIQVRSIDAGTTVGYGASHRVTARTTIATVGVGYADGFMRSLGNRASGFLAGVRVPLVGRISMDLITFDISAVPEHAARPGAMIELIGAEHDVDALAAEAGTIGYEILTSLGRRYTRVWTGGTA